MNCHKPGLAGKIKTKDLSLLIILFLIQFAFPLTLVNKKAPCTTGQKS